MLFPANHCSNTAQQSSSSDTADTIFQTLCFQFICGTLGSFGSSTDVTFIYRHFRGIHTTSPNCITMACHCHVFIDFYFLEAFSIVICKLLRFTVIPLQLEQEKQSARDGKEDGLIIFQLSNSWLFT